MTEQKSGRDGNMSRETALENFKKTGSVFHSSYAIITKEHFKESERYMHGLNVTFDNLSKCIGYMSPLESNELKKQLSGLYENLTDLECRLKRKAEYWEGMEA